MIGRSADTKAMAEVTYMTREGYNKLKEELEHMRAVERPAAAAAIASTVAAEWSAMKRCYGPP